MKRFLLRLILFFVVVFAPIVLVKVIDLALRPRISFELPKDKTVLFIGASHVQNSVNDSIVPGSFNWAMGAEFYLNMFPRIRELLEANPQIDTIFVSAAPLILGKGADGRITSSGGYRNMSMTLPLYGREELVDSWDAVAGMFIDFRSSLTALQRIVRRQTVKLETLGKFSEPENTNSVLLKQIGKLGKEEFFQKNGGGDSGNALAVKYLRKIVDFARARNVRVILLNPPVYHAKEIFDVPYYENTIKENFSDVEFWDYGDFPIPEEGFYNVNHLNGKGAEIFSKELARRIREEELTSPSST